MAVSSYHSSPKNSNPSLPENIQPFLFFVSYPKCLRPVTVKNSQLVHKNQLLSSLQSGFRPGHSTVTTLLKVTGDIKKGMEDTKVTVLVLVDFAKIFNVVSHESLLSILTTPAR